MILHLHRKHANVFGGGTWTDWKHIGASTQTWSLRAQGQRRMNGLKMRSHQHRGSALSGAGPWKVFAGGNYVETPTDDPAFLYQDVVVALAGLLVQTHSEPNGGAIIRRTMIYS